MEEYDILVNSIGKNMQEFTEFIVDEFGITNYYDLVEMIADLHNFRALAYKRDENFSKKIDKALELDGIMELQGL